MTQHTQQKHDSGFSLLELVVAVSIMLILGVVGFVAYQSYTDNARQAALDTSANQVLTAVVAEDNTPNGDVYEAVRSFNEKSDDIMVDISSATTLGLTVQATRCDGGAGIARTAGNYSHLHTTSYADVEYNWLGEAHASASTKSVCGEVVATNIMIDPRFKRAEELWQARELGQPGVRGRYEIIPRGNHFSALGDDPAIGDEIMKITRIAEPAHPADRRALSAYARLYPVHRPNIEGYSHIGYAIPMQGTGKTWMYFRKDGSDSGTQLPEIPSSTFEHGGWRTDVGEIPDGYHYADLYIGTAYDHDEPEGERFVNEVYYGSPIMVVGNSEAEVRDQLQEYFDGDM